MALGSPQAARQAAESILSEGRFHSSSVPDPLHGLLVWLGRLASDPVSGVSSLVNRLGSSFPGGVAGLWVAAGALAVVATLVLALRRSKTRIGRLQTANTVARQRPGELERAAERAEREGRWDEAVRLRFRAGLLRLGERDGVLYTETTPNHSLARMLASEPLEDLSSRFDEVVYGGDEATAADAERQRRAWPEILEGVER
jgi:hypothetical protein